MGWRKRFPLRWRTRTAGEEILPRGARLAVARRVRAAAAPAGPRSRRWCGPRGVAGWRGGRRRPRHRRRSAGAELVDQHAPRLAPDHPLGALRRPRRPHVLGGLLLTFLRRRPPRLLQVRRLPDLTFDDGRPAGRCGAAVVSRTRWDTLGVVGGRAGRPICGGAVHRVRQPRAIDAAEPPGWRHNPSQSAPSAERLEHDLGEGVPVFVATAPDGGVRVFPADRWRLRLLG
jgi:hypothetical protein